MIDLHCHLLPNIDDGPSSLQQSVRLAKLAVENGITHSILTPHIHPGRYSNSATNIKAACEQFRQTLAEREIPLQLGYAGEVRLSDEILPLIESDAIPFYGELKEHKVLLLELPHSHVPLGSENLIKWLLDRKIRPMIAHPERNKGIMQDINKIYPFIEMGCFMQLTAGSIVGLFGKPVQQCAQRLLEMNCVTVLASDAHNVEHRPPRLDHGRDAAAIIVGKKEADKMVFDRPMALVAEQFPDLTAALSKSK